MNIGCDYGTNASLKRFYAIQYMIGCSVFRIETDSKKNRKRRKKEWKNKTSNKIILNIDSFKLIACNRSLIRNWNGSSNMKLIEIWVIKYWYLQTDTILIELFIVIAFSKVSCLRFSDTFALNLTFIDAMRWEQTYAVENGFHHGLTHRCDTMCKWHEIHLNSKVPQHMYQSINILKTDIFSIGCEKFYWNVSALLFYYASVTHYYWIRLGVFERIDALKIANILKVFAMNLTIHDMKII